MKKLLVKMSGYSLQGFLRKIWLRLSKRDILITGSCSGCGSCCRKINLQAGHGWVRNETEFLKICRSHPEYRRFMVTGSDEQGFLQFSCSWRTAEGLCRDYENRLSICKGFPSKSLHFCGGGLPAACGYAIEMVTPFSHVLEKELKGGKSKEKNPGP